METNLSAKLFDQNNLVDAKDSSFIEINAIKSVLEDIKKSEIIQKFKSHEFDKPVVNVIFNPKNSSLACISRKKTIKIWNYEEDNKYFFLTGHKKSVNCAAYYSSGDFLLTGSNDHTIILWNLNEKRKHSQLEGHTKPVYCIACSSDNKFAASGSDDYIVKIWNLKENKESISLKRHTDSVNSVAFNPNNTYLASASEDKLVIVWNLQNYKLEFVLSGHTNFVKSVAWSFEGYLLATASGDHTIRLWNFQEKKQESVLKGHNASVYSVAFDNSGNYLISGSADNNIKVWNLNRRKEEYTINAHSDIISTVAITSDCAYIASGSKDRSVKIWRILQKNQEYIQTNTRINKIVHTYDGKYIAVSEKESVVIRNFETRIVEHNFKLPDPGCEILCMAYSYNGNLLACGLSNGKIKVLRIPKAEITLIINCGKDPVNLISYSPDSKLIASVSSQNSASLWVATTGDLKFNLVGHMNLIRCMNFIPSGDFLVTGSNDSLIKVWNTRSGELDFSYSGHSNSVYCTRFSPDGKFIASGSADSLVKIWSLQYKIEKFTLYGHADAVWDVSYNESGVYLASGSLDRTVRVWNVVERRQECILTDSDDMILAVAYIPKTNYLVSGSRDKKIKLWNMEHQQNISERNPIPLTDPLLQPFNLYLNGISSLKTESYANISCEAIGTYISTHLFSVLHFIAYLGLSDIIQSNFKQKEFIIKADTFGHSPLFYSIKQQHQECTDLLLEFLVNSASKNSNSIEYITSFHAIRNDFLLIIENSSRVLDKFLNALINSKSNVIFFGSPNCEIPFASYSDSVVPDLSTFLKDSSEITQNNIPLRINTFKYRLPSSVGSESSLRLLKSIMDCRNREIFRTKFIKCFIRERWGKVKWQIYIFTAILWLNLICLIGLLAKSSLNLYFLISLVSINILLTVWEIIQIIKAKLYYFKDLWNANDILKLGLTWLWILLIFLDIEIIYLNWAITALNIIRGLTGFRAFDRTRFYIRLIISCLKDIFFFLLIFIYTTIGFGLLSSISTDSEVINAQTLWITPFNLSAGQADEMSSDHSWLKYGTFCLAFVINIILMLNLIISILADSFDEFQNDSEIYDYKEMTEIVIEIEHILSFFTSESKQQYMHICASPYEESDNSWVGKVREMHNESLIIRNFVETQFENYNQISDRNSYLRTYELQKRVNSFENSINQQIFIIENKIDLLQRQIGEKFASIENSFHETNKKIENLITIISK